MAALLDHVPTKHAHLRLPAEQFMCCVVAELPESLKALFRPVSMVVPDLGLICEIMLMAEGFQVRLRLCMLKLTAVAVIGGLDKR